MASSEDRVRKVIKSQVKVDSQLVEREKRKKERRKRESERGVKSHSH